MAQPVSGGKLILFERQWREGQRVGAKNASGNEALSSATKRHKTHKDEEPFVTYVPLCGSLCLTSWLSRSHGIASAREKKERIMITKRIWWGGRVLAIAL